MSLDMAYNIQGKVSFLASPGKEKTCLTIETPDAEVSDLTSFFLQKVCNISV